MELVINKELIIVFVLIIVNLVEIAIAVFNFLPDRGLKTFSKGEKIDAADDIQKIIKDNLYNPEIIENCVVHHDYKYITQYVTNIESVNHTSNRRDDITKFYQAVIVALIGIPPIFTMGSPYFTTLLTMPLILSFIVSSLWIRHIKEFRIINKAKFLVIQEMEPYLPVNSFKTEKALLEKLGYQSVSKWELYTSKTANIFSIVCLMLLTIFIYFGISFN